MSSPWAADSKALVFTVAHSERSCSFSAVQWLFSHRGCCPEDCFPPVWAKRKPTNQDSDLIATRKTDKQDQRRIHSSITYFWLIAYKWHDVFFIHHYVLIYRLLLHYYYNYRSTEISKRQWRIHSSNQSPITNIMHSCYQWCLFVYTILCIC